MQGEAGIGWGGSKMSKPISILPNGVGLKYYPTTFMRWEKPVRGKAGKGGAKLLSL